MKLNISDNIRKYRKRLDMTQEQLAERLCVSDQIVSRWETGATYPDLELLPAMAELFAVTVDDLLGVERTEKGRVPEEIWQKFYKTEREDERLKMLHELHRDYPRDMDVLSSLCDETQDVEEKKLFALELVEKCDYGNWSRRDAFETLINLEDDEYKIKEYIDRYASIPIDREHLYESRYRSREQWDKYEPLKQSNLLKTLTWDFFDNMLSGFPYLVDAKRSFDCSRHKLGIIDLLTGTAGGSLITGDGEVDAWAANRVERGIRYSCHYLAVTGDRDGALSALEETVSFAEDVASIPDGTELTFRCQELNALIVKIKKSRLRSKNGADGYLDFPIFGKENGKEYFNSLPWFMPSACVEMLTRTSGWEWFDPIRDDPRYKKCVERLQAIADRFASEN